MRRLPALVLEEVKQKCEGWKEHESAGQRSKNDISNSDIRRNAVEDGHAGTNDVRILRSRPSNCDRAHVGRCHYPGQPKVLFEEGYNPCD